MSSRQLSEAAFDGHGQLLTASLLDYCLPRADNLPSFDFETRNVPSTTPAKPGRSGRRLR
jgi:carbon-monoxide dehydrogenase large subunit